MPSGHLEVMICVASTELTHLYALVLAMHDQPDRALDLVKSQLPARIHTLNPSAQRCREMVAGVILAGPRRIGA